ncbi:MAG TPA: DNA primase [Sediminispirochaeta sp.]|nr:DNA primase [Sediminispirochaeta sp.]
MRIPDRIIDEINRKIGIQEVVGDYVSLEQKGSRMMGLCPFHSEKTPSFSVTPEKNLFYCFGCHKGGNMFTFLMEIEHLSFVEAAQKLADRAGIEIPQSDYSDSQQSERGALLDLYGRIAGSFHYFLVEHQMGEEARHYLKKRGVAAPMWELFQLGYAPRDRYWLFRFLRSKNYSADFLAKTGLFSRKYPEVCLFSNRLIFTISDPSGQVIAFGGRSIDGGEPKYINSPETPIYQKRRALYGLHQALKGIREHGRVAVVEGYLDVIAFFQAQKPFAVAPLGTALTEEQVESLRRYTRKALLFFDDDRAGLKAAERGLELMEKEGMETRVVVPKGGQDPADIMLNEGSNSLHNMLNSALDGFEFLLQSTVARHGRGDANSKHRILASLAPFLHSVESEVKREAYIQQLANTLAVDPEAVRKDLRAILRGKQARVEGQKAVKEKDAKKIGSDLFLMLVAVTNTGYFPRIRNSISLDSLSDPQARELYIALEEAYRNDELDIDHVIPKIEHEELQHLVFEKIATGEYELNTEELVKDGIKTVRRRALEKKRDEVISKIRNFDQQGAHRDALKDLLSEKMFLDEELNRFKGDTHDRT